MAQANEDLARRIEVEGNKGICWEIVVVVVVGCEEV